MPGKHADTQRLGRWVCCLQGVGQTACQSRLPTQTPVLPAGVTDRGNREPSLKNTLATSFLGQHCSSRLPAALTRDSVAGPRPASQSALLSSPVSLLPTRICCHREAHQLPVMFLIRLFSVKMLRKLRSSLRIFARTRFCRKCCGINVGVPSPLRSISVRTHAQAHAHMHTHTWKHMHVHTRT